MLPSFFGSKKNGRQPVPFKVSNKSYESLKELSKAPLGVSQSQVKLKSGIIAQKSKTDRLKSFEIDE